MSAEVNRGYLYVEDEKGSYKIPLGRRTRSCLAVLEKKEGEYIRSLEIDLFTGFVYYCVDNATSGGLSYYYDMSSKKVGHYFIHRYLRTARSHGFTASPLETEILEKLPCEDWELQLSRLPGWKEKLENRLRGVLLPWAEPLQISLPPGGRISQETAAAPEITSVSFILSPAGYPARRREKTFLFEKGKVRYRDETVGTEFFVEDEEFERILSPDERALILFFTEQMIAGSGRDCRQLFTQEILQRLLPQKEKLVMREAVIRCADGAPCATRFKARTTPKAVDVIRCADGASCGTALESGGPAEEKDEVLRGGPAPGAVLKIPAEKDDGPLWTLYAALYGLLKREVEVGGPSRQEEMG